MITQTYFKFISFLFFIFFATIMIIHLLSARAPTKDEATFKNVRAWFADKRYEMTVGMNGYSLPLTEAGAREADMDYITSIIYEAPEFSVGFSKSGKQTFFSLSPSSQPIIFIVSFAGLAVSIVSFALLLFRKTDMQ